MTVKVVKPIKITEAVLTASSIPEPDASVGEVEWIEDRRKVMDVDFGGQSVFSGGYTDAHFIPANPYTSNHGSVYFESANPADNATSIETLKYNISYSDQSFECSYDSIVICNVSSFIDATNTIFIGCAVEKYSQSNSVGRSCFFVMNKNSNDISAVFADDFELAQTYTRLEMPSVLTNVNEGSTFTFFVIDSIFHSIFRNEVNGLWYAAKWDINGTNTETKQVYKPIASPKYIYLDGKYRAYGGNTPYPQDFYYLSNNEFETSQPVRMPQSYEPAVNTAFTDGDNIFISYSNNSRIEIFTADTGESLGYYQPGERAILTSAHKLYQCVKATNIRPDLGATGDESETWVEVSPTNRWSIFTDTINSASIITKDSEARQREFILKPQQKFTSCAIFGCSGLKQVFFQVLTSGGVLRQSVKVDMIDHDATLEWGLDDASPAFIDSAFFDGLNYFDGDYFKLIIDAQSGFEGRVKLFAFGIDRYVGEAINESMSKNYIDLSVYENDQFGNTRITKRPVVALNTYSALVDGVRIDVVDRFLNSLAGEFNVWLADIGNGQKILTYGAYDRTPTEINHNSYRVYTATIRSAI